MSVIQNEAVNVTMGITEKGIEAGTKVVTNITKGLGKSVVALLNLILGREEKKALKLKNELNKMKIKDLKNDKYRKKMIDYVNTKKGIIKLKKIIKSQEQYTTLVQTMSKKDLEKFNKYAKAYGISYAVIENKFNKQYLKDLQSELKELNSISEPTKEQIQRREQIQKEINDIKNNPTKFQLVVLDKDLEVINQITAQMNREKRLEAIDKEIEDMQSDLASNEKTAEEKEEIENRIEDLEREKESINDKYIEDINEKSFENIEQDRVREGNFEQVVNELATSSVDDKSKIVCNATNPKDYMIVSTQPAIYDDRECKKTTFDVFKNDVQQKCDYYSHGEFCYLTDLKNGTYTSEQGMKNWENLKYEMAEKLELTNSKDVLIFDNKAEYEKYRNNFENNFENEKSSKENSVTYEADNNSYIDVAGIENKLKSQVEDIKSDIKNSISPKTEQSFNKKTDLINKEIACYSELSELQNEKKFITSQIKMNEKTLNNEENKGLYEANDRKFKSMLNDVDEKINNKLAEIEDIERDKAFFDTKIDEEQENISENDLENKDVKTTLREEKEERNDKEYQSKEQWTNDISNKTSNSFGRNTEKVSAKSKGERE